MIMEIRGHGGITHFGNSEGKGGLKCGSRPWYGTDIFWNRPFTCTIILLQKINKIINQKNSCVLIIIADCVCHFTCVLSSLSSAKFS